MAVESKPSFRWELITNKNGEKRSLEETHDLPEVVRRVRALKKLRFEKLRVDTELMNENSNFIRNKIGEKLSLEEIHDLPEAVRRMRALQKLQFECIRVGEGLDEELKRNKSKFEDKYQSIYEKRSQIINGNVEPNEEECDFDLESQESLPTIQSKDPIEGIPGFWLKSLSNFEVIRQWITREDESALLHLKDIKINFIDDSNRETKMSLEFRFDQNEYFTNEVLTKEYQLEFEPESGLLWRNDYYCLMNGKGCQIDWKEGKNLIRRSGTPRNIGDITSFFCFFLTPEDPKRDSKDNDLMELFKKYWEIDFIITEKVVPDAVLCFTGELLEDQWESEQSDAEETDSASDHSD